MTPEEAQMNEDLSRVHEGINLRKIYFLIHPLTYAPECADATFRAALLKAEVVE